MSAVDRWMTESAHDVTHNCDTNSSGRRLGRLCSPELDRDYAAGAPSVWTRVHLARPRGWPILTNIWYMTHVQQNVWTCLQALP